MSNQQSSPRHKVVPSTTKAACTNNFNPQPQATKSRTKSPLKALGSNIRMYVNLMSGAQNTHASRPSPLVLPPPAMPATPEVTTPNHCTKNTRASESNRNFSTNASLLIARGIFSPRSRDATKTGKPRPTIRRSPSIALTDEARSTLLRSGDSALERVDGPCTGGVYTLQQKREEGGAVVAVFKPEDEETGWSEGRVRCGEPNPERAGMVVGGGACRERAAYVLDRQSHHFSGVPPTQLACITTNMQENGEREVPVTKKPGRSRRGSIQRFCPNDGSVEDRYDLLRRASVLQAQRIGVLDMRIFNTDRHGGNVLCTEMSSRSMSTTSSATSSPSFCPSPTNNNRVNEEEEEKQQENPINDEEQSPVTLVPIDHALTLPDWQHLGEAYLDWGMWPQARDPWHPSVIAAVAAINIAEDAQQLRALDIRESSVATMEICSTVLKAGVLKGGIQSLADGAKLFERPFTAGHARHATSRSALEVIVSRAAAACGIVYPDHNSSAANERPPDQFFDALNEQLDELMPNQQWKSLETCKTV